jgi:hypothetical protein
LTGTPSFPARCTTTCNSNELDTFPITLSLGSPYRSKRPSSHLTPEDEQMQDKIVVSNDESTVVKFRFSKNGNKLIKTSNIEGLWQQHYKYTTNGCEARYCEDYVMSNSDKIITYTFTENHNHCSPSNPKMIPQVKRRCTDLLRAGVSVAVVYKRAVNDAPLPLIPENVPSLAQVKSWGHRTLMDTMPTSKHIYHLLLKYNFNHKGDVFCNITIKHSNFALLCAYHPNIMVALATDFGLDLLAKSFEMCIDSTFETTKNKLVLTVVLTLLNGVAIPSAFFLSNSRETDTYEMFFRVRIFILFVLLYFWFLRINIRMQVINKHTKGVMRPTKVYMDFEKALSDSFTNVFPLATIARDRFHFIQANVRKMSKLGYGPSVSDLVKDLNVLWEKPSKEDFDTYLLEFLDKWNTISSYCGYFRSTWLELHPSKDWAKYRRRPGARSGMQFLLSKFTV